MAKNYPPDVIDVAIVATIRMLIRGKVIEYQDNMMRAIDGVVHINGELVGDIVDATLLWFVRYSSANPYAGNWGATRSSIEFLKRRFI